MLPIGAVLVDFDGTACLHDAAEHLLIEFADPSWPSYDAAVDRGEIGLRASIEAQDGLLDADHDTMLAFALDHCPIDPTFGPFCDWLAEQDIAVTVVSDGFGFYLEPILSAHGLGDLTVISNEQRWGQDGRPSGMVFANGHPVCVGCGTCKMQAVQRARERHGSVVFIGDGQTDRYAALYADQVFAKRDLPGYCRADGVPFIGWDTFADVRRHLEASEPLPGPVAPVRCPGWTEPI